MRRHTGRAGSRAAVAVGALVLCAGLLLSMCGTSRHDGLGAAHGTPAHGTPAHGTPAHGTANPGTADPGTLANPGAPQATAPQATAPGFGLTHTQYSADQGDAAARRTARATLSVQPLPQDQAIMGWGADNPEPAPGHYDFGSLDRRVALIRATGGTPVITLCCSPDWMKGGAAGTTDWSRLEAAPDPAHYADFAALAATIARRYPDVTHFIVWNEFKGFWNDRDNRWDVEDYTRMYNLVYRAVKKAAPRDLVGGPYLDMDSVAPGDPTNASAVRGSWGSVDQRVVDALEYWLRHKAGADFLVVDGSSTTHDDALVPGPFTATGKFADVGDWLRRVDGGLPVWWAEWYVEPDTADWPAGQLLAVQAVAMMELVEGGASAAFYWNPETSGGSCPGCLWRPTGAGADGGTPLPMADLLRRFAAAFPPGTVPRAVAAGTPKVRVLGGVRTVLAVNTTGLPLTARVDGARVTLPPYGVDWLAARPTPHPDPPPHPHP